MNATTITPSTDAATERPDFDPADLPGQSCDDDGPAIDAPYVSVTITLPGGRSVYEGEQLLPTATIGDMAAALLGMAQALAVRLEGAQLPVQPSPRTDQAEQKVDPAADES